MILGRADMQAHTQGGESPVYLPGVSSWQDPGHLYLRQKTAMPACSSIWYDPDDEMLSILFFIQGNIVSSLAKEQFDKNGTTDYCPLPKAPFLSEIQPGAYSI